MRICYKEAFSLYIHLWPNCLLMFVDCFSHRRWLIGAIVTDACCWTPQLQTLADQWLPQLRTVLACQLSQLQTLVCQLVAMVTDAYCWLQQLQPVAPGYRSYRHLTSQLVIAIDTESTDTAVGCHGYKRLLLVAMAAAGSVSRRGFVTMTTTRPLTAWTAVVPRPSAASQSFLRNTLRSIHDLDQ